MPEVRFVISEKLEKNIHSISKDLGCNEIDYVKSLIIQDLRNKGIKQPE